MEKQPDNVRYCVERVVTFNRGTASERVVMTGDWDEYSTMAEARVQARLRDVEVFALAAAPTCGHCGSVKPTGQSCGCFDNGGE